MYWCWGDFHQERFPQQRPRDTHCGVRNCLLPGTSSETKDNQIQEPVWWLRARGTSQCPCNWPCPQARYYSWIGSLNLFFLQKFLGGLEFVLMQNRKILRNLKKSSGMRSLFLPQLFFLKLLIQRELEISEGKTAKNIIAESSSSQFVWEHQSMPVSLINAWSMQVDQSTGEIALFSAAQLPITNTRLLCLPV